MTGLEDRVALVTGAGSAAGIGFATARILAAQGARLAITSTTERIFERLGELPGGEKRHVAVIADLTQADAADRLVAEARKGLGPIDILVNNAGIQHVAPVEEFPPEEWDAILAINLSAAFHAIRAVLPEMKRRGFGRIAPAIARAS